MIAITGATGRLGRLVIDHLIRRGAEPSGIIAAVRSPEKAADLAARGVVVREADYTRPETLGPAFDGVDRLLLISASDVGKRTAQHRNVIEAAKGAGVGLLVYTSVAHADTSPLMLAAEHRETEAAIRASGLPFALLRNGWYTENYTGTLAQTLQQGAILGSAGEGRVSAATRDDYAEAAAVVLTSDGHEGAVYELGGDDAFTMSEMAEEITRQSGTEVVYRDVPPEEYERALVGFGLPDDVAALLRDFDEAIAQGALRVESGDLRRIIGRPTTPLADAVADDLPG
ncbi:MAG: SDR family oxidoreductase [Rhodothermales bacterium]